MGAEQHAARIMLKSQQHLHPVGTEQFSHVGQLIAADHAVVMHPVQAVARRIETPSANAHDSRQRDPIGGHNQPEALGEADVAEHD